jgi:hypothetical protein
MELVKCDTGPSNMRLAGYGCNELFCSVAESDDGTYGLPPRVVLPFSGGTKNYTFACGPSLRQVEMF